MQRHCDGTDRNLTTPAGVVCACGERLTTGQLQAMMDVRQAAEQQHEAATRLADLITTAHDEHGVTWRLLGALTGMNYTTLYRQIQAGSPVTVVRTYQNRPASE